ncbi:MAG: hypothetical protein HFI63_11580 [Lachnospiraceae bacterium]|nr:hypothetical protein [Lachnospiraceae bacterium]
MRILYMRNLLVDIWKRKVAIGIVILVCIVLSCFTGYRKVEKQKSEIRSPEYLEKLAEFEANLEEFDKLIADMEDTIPTAEAQVEKQKEYCENSVYMQLDSQNFSVYTAQYAVQTEGNVSHILGTMTAYINDGGLKEELVEEGGAIPEEYLREIISCSTSGNVLTITTMHYDATESKELLQAICNRVEDYAAQIVPAQGEFQFKQLEVSAYKKADASVMNAQNSALSALRSLESNLSDSRQKLINQKNAKTSYMENNKPQAPEVDGLFKTLIKRTIYGFILGAVLSVAVLVLKGILAGCLKSRGELLAAGFSVFGEFDSKKGYHPSLERSVMDVELLAKQTGSGHVFLNCLYDGEACKKAAEEYTAEIRRHDLEAETGYAVRENAGEMKKMMDAGSCIFVVQIGKTTYTQLEEQRELCQQFGISVWGCILVG